MGPVFFQLGKKKQFSKLVPGEWLFWMPCHQWNLMKSFSLFFLAYLNTWRHQISLCSASTHLYNSFLRISNLFVLYCWIGHLYCLMQWSWALEIQVANPEGCWKTTLRKQFLTQKQGTSPSFTRAATVINRGGHKTWEWNHSATKSVSTTYVEPFGDMSTIKLLGWSEIKWGQGWIRNRPGIASAVIEGLNPNKNYKYWIKTVAPGPYHHKQGSHKPRHRDHDQSILPSAGAGTKEEILFLPLVVKLSLILRLWTSLRASIHVPVAQAELGLRRAVVGDTGLWVAIAPCTILWYYKIIYIYI